MQYLDAWFRQPEWMLHPMQAFIRHEDAVRYEEIRTWRVHPESDVEYLLFYVEGDLTAYRERVAALESVVDWRLAPIDEESAHVWACQESRPETRSWRTAFADRDLLVVPPIEFDEEAAMRLRVVGDGDELQATLSAVPDAIDVTVNEVGAYDRRAGTLAGALTDRQYEAVAAAFEAGYYEVPREATLGAVAGALDCTESTASVLLRRAERAVFGRLLERYGGAVDRLTD